MRTNENIMAKESQVNQTFFFHSHHASDNSTTRGILAVKENENILDFIIGRHDRNNLTDADYTVFIASTERKL